MLPDISIKPKAILDNSGMYCVNMAYIIPEADKYLLAILNSNLIHFFYSNLTSLIRGGYLRFIRQYLAQIPIAKVDKRVKDEIELLIDQILDTKKQLTTSNTKDIENQIDQLVYELYGLSEEEIGIVEKSTM